MKKLFFSICLLFLSQLFSISRSLKTPPFSIEGNIGGNLLIGTPGENSAPLEQRYNIDGNIQATFMNILYGMSLRPHTAEISSSTAGLMFNVNLYYYQFGLGYTTGTDPIAAVNGVSTDSYYADKILYNYHILNRYHNLNFLYRIPFFRRNISSVNPIINGIFSPL